MKRYIIIVMVTLTLSLGIVGAHSALAASPVGEWKVTFYLEPGLSTGATQGICFKADGTWYSTTFAGWDGDWLWKGDRLRWYGDTGSLGTAEFGQFSSKRKFAGEFAHFTVPGAPPVTSTRGNYEGRKVSRRCSPPAGPIGLGIGTSPDPAAQ